MQMIASKSKDLWVANDACAAAVMGVLVAAFCALQSRRNAQKHRDLETADPPTSFGIRMCVVVAILAALATYACLFAVRHHLRGSSFTTHRPSSSPTAIDREIEAAFDEAALLRHVHRGSPGF